MEVLWEGLGYVLFLFSFCGMLNVSLSFPSFPSLPCLQWHLPSFSLSALLSAAVLRGCHFYPVPLILKLLFWPCSKLQVLTCMEHFGFHGCTFSGDDLVLLCLSPQSSSTFSVSRKCISVSPHHTWCGGGGSAVGICSVFLLQVI